MFAYEKPQQKQESKNTVQKKETKINLTRPNFTGIPDATKTQFENLSGFSFDDVRVHYNSYKPAQLQALAYTQGNQVYVGPGQEGHLGHELGHVVQQKQGIVRPTKTVNGMHINDDNNLESAASNISAGFLLSSQTSEYNAVIQRKLVEAYNDNEIAALFMCLPSDPKVQRFKHFYKGRDVDDKMIRALALEFTTINFITPDKAADDYTLLSSEKTIPKDELAIDLSVKSKTSEEAKAMKWFQSTYPGEDIERYSQVVCVDERFHLKLGFNSVAVMKKEETGSDYKILTILKKSGAKGTDAEMPPSTPRGEYYEHKPFSLMDSKIGSKFIGSVSSVVTYEISSCTFIALADRDEKYAVVMHLDEGDIVPVQQITRILREAGIEDVRADHLFVSKIEGDEEQMKVMAVRDHLYKHPPLFGSPTTTILERGRIPHREDKSAYVPTKMHEKIGVSFTDHGAVVTGAIADQAFPHMKPNKKFFTKPL